MDARRVVVPWKCNRSGDARLAYATDLADMLDAELETLPGASKEDVRLFDFESDDILVAPWQVSEDVTTLIPFDESGLLLRGLEHKVLIPLSGDWSGLYATREVMPLLRRLGFSIVFWHSTWRDLRVSSAEPRDHMLASAKVTEVQAQDIAREYGVGFESLVETAETIDGGLVFAACLHRCPLIVMARGRNTVLGSYVDDVLEGSHIPVLIMGREAEAY